MLNFFRANFYGEISFVDFFKALFLSALIKENLFLGRFFKSHFFGMKIFLVSFLGEFIKKIF